MSNVTYQIISPETPKEFEAYYHFRWSLLRKPLYLPQGSEQDELEKKSFHCMALTANKSIIGIGRIHFENERDVRIRYMAVHEDYRRQGVGSALIVRLLEWAMQKQANRCWLKARENAVAFYVRQGFDLIEETSSDLNVKHFLMEKILPSHKNN